jgi:hypothetical protein
VLERILPKAGKILKNLGITGESRLPDRFTSKRVKNLGHLKERSLSEGDDFTLLGRVYGFA